MIKRSNLSIFTPFGPVGAEVFLCIALFFSFVVSYGQNRPLERGVDQWTAIGGGEETVADSFAEEEEEAVTDSTPLGVDLVTLVLISDQSYATMDPSAASTPLLIGAGVEAPEELSARVQPFLGQPLSMKLLADLSSEIVLAWRSSNYPLVDVYFPEQNITGGKLQVVVKEAVLGEVSVDGARVTRESMLLSQIRVSPGDRLGRRQLDSDLDWINENPIRQVNLVYEKGVEDGTSDIVLDVVESDPLSFYVGFGNTGVDFTGENEVNFGAVWMNPLEGEHIVGYNFASDVDFEHLEAHSAYYKAYLPWRHVLSLFGAYVESEAANPGIFDTEGTSGQFTFDYRVPLQRPAVNRNFSHHLAFGFDYKTTDTDLIFGSLNLLNTRIAVGQFRGEYGFRLRDKGGVIDFRAGVAGSPGDMFDFNDDLSFGLARYGSTSDYSYLFAEIERFQRLPRDMTMRFRLSGQSSSDRLAATEQILAGGYQTVRGFDESVVRGDSGVIANLELYSPEFSFGWEGMSGQKDASQFFLFWDAAALQVEGKLPGEVSPSIQSIGLGLNCRLGDKSVARASYGWPIQSHGLPMGARDDGRFHFGITLSY
ncbi:MAG: ShlB/FhaC/HecB family hemolysin secretion/activation protein [Verrucomicrobiales bacterium]|nr:ShlB/FhaC/HecB family hemolysin secretion/activation protein [Verrucomicrobiales bacterium]